MKIKYVQLESVAFLTDLDFISMSPAERGMYCNLVFFLNANGSKYEIACLNSRYYREIRKWLRQMYLFPPMQVDPDGFDGEYLQPETSNIYLHK